ncbi:hypothetical protein BDR06DRAFT_971584 [Suillus hirtellus]|nr:hypothetical protein BDR06DRAFT_971584 [Suillus hirtellus]
MPSPTSTAQSLAKLSALAKDCFLKASSRSYIPFKTESILQKNGEPGIILMYDDVHVHTAKEYHRYRAGRILDDMLTTPHWSHIAEVWRESDREDLTMIRHNLDDTNMS